MLDEILDSIMEKGWNVYSFIDENLLDDSILRGNIKKLKKNRDYILLPAVSNTFDAFLVKVAMQAALEIKLMPEFSHENKKYSLYHFCTEEEDVVIIKDDIRGNVIRCTPLIALTYKQFLDDLSTLSCYCREKLL